MNKESRKYLVAAFSLGVGLTFGAPVYGLMWQLFGYSSNWGLSIAATICGVTLALIAGIALLIERFKKKSSSK